MINNSSPRKCVNPNPQNAPGASAAVGHTIENSIPLSIFPVSIDKLFICFCGLPGRGKSYISRRLARYVNSFAFCVYFHCIIWYDDIDI